MIARFHYEDEVLSRFLHDRPSGAEGDVQAHVEKCETCQDHLEMLSAGGMTWDDVCEFMRQDDELDFERGGDDVRPSFAAAFLEASDRPGSLGKFGRYEILEILGRGGMGIVMRGIDSALDRHCAIKVLAPELASSAAARKRFSREARSAAAVVHSHVVPIQTVDEHNGMPYLVMPVVEGRSLQQRVEQDGPLSVIEVVRISAQIAEGLAAAHSQGLVHRDIKPANILLENGVERVQITDFGLARAVDDASVTRSGVIAGTPQYMSPEQAHGDIIDHRSDLFSLGSVMYYMLTGRSPFRAETAMGVLNRICNDAPRPLRSVNAEVPPWLEKIVARLLEKAPGDRFQSAEKVAELLTDSITALNSPDSGRLVALIDGNSNHTAVAARPAKPPHHLRRILFAAGFAFLTLAATVFYVKTNQGTLQIESNSDVDVPIRILSGGETVEHLTISKEGDTSRLQAGNYVVEVDDPDSHVEIKGDRFTLRRGDTWIVTIAPVEGSRGPAQTQEDLPAAADNPLNMGSREGGYRPPSIDGSKQSDGTDPASNVLPIGDAAASESEFPYFEWRSVDQVVLTKKFADQLDLDEAERNEVSQLLERTWQAYIELENRNVTQLTRMSTLGVNAEIDIPEEKLEELRRQFLDDLNQLVNEKVASRIYAVAINRHAKQADDVWSNASDAYPSILGWSDESFPVAVQIMRRGREAHWWIRPGKHGVTGRGAELPHELEHYLLLGQRPVFPGRSSVSPVDDPFSDLPLPQAPADPFSGHARPQLEFEGDESVEPLESANRSLTNQLLAASVRIRVDPNGSNDLGSGTIISSKSGISHILTSAHLFRNANERILVEVFDDGVTTAHVARLTLVDASSDLGLITIPTKAPLPVAKVGARDAAPRWGDTVAAISCRHGDDPTIQKLQVTDIDKFEGPHNIVCTGMPVKGCSGGGLFNVDGEIVGVCCAADPQEKRGYYAGLRTIHQLLDARGMSSLYRSTPPPSRTPAEARDVLENGRVFPTLQSLEGQSLEGQSLEGQSLEGQSLEGQTTIDLFGTPGEQPPWPRYRLAIFQDGTLSFLGKRMSLKKLNELPVEKLNDDGGRLGIVVHVDVPFQRVKEVIDAIQSTQELKGIALSLYEFRDDGEAFVTSTPFADVATPLERQSQESIQVRIDGPQGLQMTRLPEDTNGSPYEDLPLRQNYLVTETVSLRFKAEAGAFDGQLEFAMGDERVANFTRHNAVPIHITSEDVEQLAAGNRVVKAYYVPHADKQDEGRLSVEVVADTRVQRDVDIILEARRKGSLIGVLTLSPPADGTAESASEAK